MKSLLTIAFLISCAVCQAQVKGFEVFAQYEYLVNPETSPFKINYNSTLLANSRESVFEVQLKSDQDATMSTDKGSFVMPASSSNSFYYKNIEKNLMVNKESITTKKFVVEDKLDIFQWTLAPEKTEILGYKCQKATASFRGREYVAYFTPEIPLQNGPWKFHGLPGLILQVYSIDGMFKLTAKEVRVGSGNSAIGNPFAESKPIPYQEYVRLYNKKYQETLGYRGENGMTLSMPKRKIEVLVND